MIHSVYFWLSDAGNPSHRQELITGLEELRAIQQVRSLTIGTPAPTEARDVVDASFDVFEQMVFDSIEDQKAYQDHPLHHRFVERCGHLWSRVVVYDSVATSA